jgi:hypothetical protein
MHTLGTCFYELGGGIYTVGHIFEYFYGKQFLVSVFLIFAQHSDELSLLRGILRHRGGGGHLVFWSSFTLDHPWGHGMGQIKKFIGRSE